jgi:hypothetical protein
VCKDDRVYLNKDGTTFVYGAYGISAGMDGQYGGSRVNYLSSSWDIIILTHESGHNVIP